MKYFSNGLQNTKYCIDPALCRSLGQGKRLVVLSQNLRIATPEDGSFGVLAVYSFFARYVHYFMSVGNRFSKLHSISAKKIQRRNGGGAATNNFDMDSKRGDQQRSKHSIENKEGA